MVTRPFNLPKNFDPKLYEFKKGFPTVDNCDPADPKERFLPFLVALPGVRGAQMIFPVGYNMLISEHLSHFAMRTCEKCGYEKVPEKKYQPPGTSDPHWLTSPGRWVKPDAPDVQPHKAREVLGRLSSGQKAELFRELKASLSDTEVKGLLLGDLSPEVARELRDSLDEYLGGEQ